MSIRTVIKYKYQPDYWIRSCIAISKDTCILLGTHLEKPGKFLVLNEGNVRQLSYEIPQARGDHRGALYKTETGFGCIFDTRVVEYDFFNDRFSEYPIENPLPKDDAGRTTGPLGRASRMSDNQLLVPLEHYFIMFHASYMTTLSLGSDSFIFSPFIYSLKKSHPSSHLQCSVTYIDNKTIFHRCKIANRKADHPNNYAELCELKKGAVQIISSTSFGEGSFATDNSCLMVKTKSKPFKFEIYSLDGEKEHVIPITPKRFLGNVDKRHLTFFDKYGNTLWIASDCDVTEIQLSL